MVLGVVISMLRVGPRHLADWTSAPFAGLDNFRIALDAAAPTGSELLASLGRTTAFTVLVVGLSYLLGLAATVALTSPFRGRAVFSVLFLLPFALPAFVTVLSWRTMLDRDTGVLNHLLVDTLGLVDDRPFWLIGPNAFWATVTVGIWRLWPFAYLVLAAAVRAVPTELYQAAMVDGAGDWHRLRQVTMPSIRRATTLAVLVMGMWTVTDFSTPYLLFGADPPPSATLLANLVYRVAFVQFDLSLASAMNILLALLVSIVAGLYVWRLFPRVATDV